MNKEQFITKCQLCCMPISPFHTEKNCLKIQLKSIKEDRDKWKEAWFAQREATGKVAWEWMKEWHPAQKG